MIFLHFLHIGTSAGVGFAIPSSTVVRIVPQLIQFGKVSFINVVLMEALLYELPNQWATFSQN